jgi:type VI secretion system secreted protein Hcp
MPIYMKYGAIDGSVTSEGHDKWIEVNSFQWGVGRGITSAAGSGTNREASTPSVSEITVTKATDVSSTKLLQEALYGEGLLTKFDFVKTDKGKAEVYMQYELENALVSGYSVSSGGDRPQESLSLNFTKITYNNVGMGAVNETGTPERVNYDLAKQVAG